MWLRAVALVAVTAAALGTASLPTSASPTASSGDVATVDAPAERLGAHDQRDPRAAAGHHLVGYFTSWGIYERDFQVADIPAERLTHVTYAFANVVGGRCVVGDPWADIERPLPSDDPTLPYRGNFNQLQVLKQEHPHLSTVLSVGGWTWSAGFSSAASTPAGRSTLAASCVDMMERYGFDGLDIDWEYPVSGGAQPGRAADRANHVALLAELRSRLDALGARTGESYTLSVAAAAGPTNMANLDIPGIVSHVDWVNVMAYDFAGDWSPSTGHNAPLYSYPGIEDASHSLDSAMRRWVQAGAPPGKLVGGLAFFGRGFGGVASPAPGAPFSSVPWGTSEAGQFDYAHLAEEVLSGMQLSFDPTARVPYAYDPAARVWISYDDPRSIEEKTRYLGRQGYGGAMVWELSNDAGGVLLDAALRGFDS